MINAGRKMEHWQSSNQTPYFRELSRTALLSAADEKLLVVRVARGDQKARDLLVRSNLRLVVSIARAYAGQGLNLDDLIEEGTLGLLRAADKFDPGRNTRFSTYAVYWIKQSIREALRYSTSIIRIPNATFTLLGKWRRATSRLQSELGRVPSDAEIAEHLQLSPSKLDLIKQAIRVWQGAPQTGANAREQLDDLFRDHNAPFSPEAEGTDNQHYVREYLKRLSSREAAVLRMRFGFDDHPVQTLQEIGAQLGLTRERVRQIQEEALAKLRRFAHGAPPRTKTPTLVSCTA